MVANSNSTKKPESLPPSTQSKLSEHLGAAKIEKDHNTAATIFKHKGSPKKNEGAAASSEFNEGGRSFEKNGTKLEQKLGNYKFELGGSKFEQKGERATDNFVTKKDEQKPLMPPDSARTPTKTAKGEGVESKQILQQHKKELDEKEAEEKEKEKEGLSADQEDVEGDSSSSNKAPGVGKRILSSVGHAGVVVAKAALLGTVAGMSTAAGVLIHGSAAADVGDADDEEDDDAEAGSDAQDSEKKDKPSDSSASKKKDIKSSNSKSAAEDTGDDIEKEKEGGADKESEGGAGEEDQEKQAKKIDEIIDTRSAQGPVDTYSASSNKSKGLPEEPLKEEDKPSKPDEEGEEEGEGEKEGDDRDSAKQESSKDETKSAPKETEDTKAAPTKSESANDEAEEEEEEETDGSEPGMGKRILSSMGQAGVIMAKAAWLGTVAGVSTAAGVIRNNGVQSAQQSTSADEGTEGSESPDADEGEEKEKKPKSASSSAKSEEKPAAAPEKKEDKAGKAKDSITDDEKTESQKPAAAKESEDKEVTADKSIKKPDSEKPAASSVEKKGDKPIDSDFGDKSLEKKFQKPALDNKFLNLQRQEEGGKSLEDEAEERHQNVEKLAFDRKLLSKPAAADGGDNQKDDVTKNAKSFEPTLDEEKMAKEDSDKQVDLKKKDTSFSSSSRKEDKPVESSKQSELNKTDEPESKRKNKLPAAFEKKPEIEGSFAGGAASEQSLGNKLPTSSDKNRVAAPTNTLSSDYMLGTTQDHGNANTDGIYESVAVHRGPDHSQGDKGYSGVSIAHKTAQGGLVEQTLESESGDGTKVGGLPGSMASKIKTYSGEKMEDKGHLPAAKDSASDQEITKNVIKGESVLV